MKKLTCKQKIVNFIIGLWSWSTLKKIVNFIIRLFTWFKMENINQAINFLFSCVSIIVLIGAMNLFVILKKPLATIESVDVIVRNDCGLLENFYEKKEKDIPQDLLEYCKALDEGKFATPPDWLYPIPLILYSPLQQPSPTWDLEMEEELPLQQPSFIWDLEMEDDLKKSLEAHQALAYSRYGIFSVQVRNEGDLDIKDAVVFSVVDKMYYVKDDEVTKEEKSDKFNLQKGGTEFVKFQMHFGQQLSMIEGDLTRHFDIVYEEGKVEEINRKQIKDLLWLAFRVTLFLPIGVAFILSMLRAFEKWLGKKIEKHNI